MAQEKRDNRILVNDTAKLLEGAEAIYQAVSTTYGPKGKNVLLEKPYGRPVLTRDGATIAREIYFSDRAKNVATQMINESSQTTNKVAGDGTSATVILAYHLLQEGFKQIAAGTDAMEVRQQIMTEATKLLEKLQGLSSPVKKGQLAQVATVSSGDENLGKMIAGAVEHVGVDGGILTEKAHVSGVEREYVDGYYLTRGFTALTEGRREIETPDVVVSAKKIQSNADAIELLKQIQGATKKQAIRVAFVGEIEGEAYNTIVTNVMKGVIDGVIIQTPPAGNMGVQYLEDIAIYTGATLITESDSLKNLGNFLGSSKKVVCTQSSSTIFGGEYSEEDFDSRVAQLEDRLKTEENEFLVEKIVDRLSKLKGKIALFRIGGATDTEKEEKEFRIEDAIQSTRAAAKDGVVPGGGTTLVRLAKDASPMFRNALLKTFKKLIDNAALPSEVKLNEILDSDFGIGFNLRKDDKPRNLIEEGILDATLVIEQVIDNAASTAGNMLTTGLTVIFEDAD